MRKYIVVFERSSTGWCAFYPDLPGLASCADTWEEIQVLTLEGLNFHIEAMLRDGDPIPLPKQLAEYLDVELPNALLASSGANVRAA